MSETELKHEDEPFEKEGIKIPLSSKSLKPKHDLDKESEPVSDITDVVIGIEGAKDRDKKYTSLLHAYLLNYKLDKYQIKRQKKRFFTLVFTIIGILLFIEILAIILCIFFGKEKSLAIIISASVSIIGSLIALPTVIAKHLFPEKIDENMAKVLQCMIDNDRSIRDAQINSIHREQSDKK